MKVIKYCLIMVAGIMLTIACGVSRAQVVWPAGSPTEVFRAPPPDNLAEREAAFAERNSLTNIALLAQQFFGLMNVAMISISDPAAATKIAGAINKQQWAEALEAYRDFFVKRMRFPPASWYLGGITTGWGCPLKPKPPTFSLWRYIHIGDELMDSTVRLNGRDKNGSNVTFRLNIGQPGRVNWTWSPPEYTTALFSTMPSNTSQVSFFYSQPDFFNALLNEYLKTGEKRYLDKWAEFSDDRFLNWRRDCAKNGFVPINWNAEHFYTIVWIPVLSYLAREAPNFQKDLPPATLARELLRLWVDCVPRGIRSVRCSNSNRLTGQYGQPLLHMAVLFPEFKPALYCLQEYRRLVEVFTTVEMTPDGGDMEPWICYNTGTPLGAYLTIPNVLWQMELGPISGCMPWATPEWRDENLYDPCVRRLSYLAHRLINGGILPYTQDRSSANFVFKNNELERIVLKMKPEDMRIRNAVFGDGLGEPPTFHSEAFPYVGYYYLRNGWTTNDQCLFMPSTRPGLNYSFPYNNGITLYAHGQELLWITYDTPITVDGCPQINPMSYNCYPPEERARRVPMYGKNESGSAYPDYHKPLKNRWLDSENFAMCEGTYAGPFAGYLPSTWPYDPKKPWIFWAVENDPNNKFINDVAHHRQVLFLKKAGLYVVTDRVRTKSPHEFMLTWQFVPPAQEAGGLKKLHPGFTDDQVTLDSQARSIKTSNTNTANLSIYHFSRAQLHVAKTNFFYLDAVGCTSTGKYGGSFRSTSDQMLVSVLYPRRTVQDELADIRPLGDASAGNSFEAALSDGTRVLYRGALNEAVLKVDDVEINGQGLLLLESKEDKKRGIALGCSSFKIGGREQKVEMADFEFELDGRKLGAVTPIYRPMDMVEFSPQADCFTDRVEVAMSCADPDVDIRYTLDWSEPDGYSRIYTAPVVLRTTTPVKARAFRKGVTRVPPTVSGTEVTAVKSAVYTREDGRSPFKATTAAQHGLTYMYYEENPLQLSSYVLEMIKPAKTGVAKELFDISAKGTNGVYAFVYYGFIDIPVDGVYSFHAPMEFINPAIDCGYELRVFLGNKEWYPATRIHNYGTWSVPLQKGLHPFKVVWVDQRKQDVWDGENRDRVWDGEKPALEISGPGLNRQPIPVSMLYPY